MMLNDVTGQAGARQRRKRVGRGESSGHGKTCGRGNKGAQSRAGSGVGVLYQGGQMPVFRRVPKRGFSNFHFAVEYAPVQLVALGAAFKDGEKVTPEALRQAGLCHAQPPLVKILGKGPLSRKLTIEAHAFSAGARAAIEQAGGTANVIAQRDPAAQWKAKRNSRKAERKAKKTSAPAAR